MSALAPAGILGGVLSAPLKAAAGIALSAVNGWIVAGAETMLREVIAVISLVTTPSLSNSWFSAHYWQVAALAMLLTLPFLFAAAVQAILRSDLNLLLRAALFDLPIAAVAVYAAAPLITLMLSATDEMCALVMGSGPVGGSFLSGLPLELSKAGSGFLIVAIAVVILVSGLVLLVELIVRSAAIYVVVLFLPLGFAAMVWPARRIWIKRMLETLIALILSKFAMVAILTLAVSALASLSEHPTALTTALTAMALLIIATVSPWALLRLLPFTELAASAALALHSDTGGAVHEAAEAVGRTALGAVIDPLSDGALRRYANDGSATPGEHRGSRGTALAVLGSGSDDGGDGGMPALGSPRDPDRPTEGPPAPDRGGATGTGVGEQTAAGATSVPRIDGGALGSEALTSASPPSPAADGTGLDGTGRNGGLVAEARVNAGAAPASSSSPAPTTSLPLLPPPPSAPQLLPPPSSSGSEAPTPAPTPAPAPEDEVPLLNDELSSHLQFDTWHRTGWLRNPAENPTADEEQP